LIDRYKNKVQCVTCGKWDHEDAMAVVALDDYGCPIYACTGQCTRKAEEMKDAEA
jgi:hypothetical protein